MSKTVMIKQKRLKGYLQNFNVLTNRAACKIPNVCHRSSLENFNVFARWIPADLCPDSGFRSIYKTPGQWIPADLCRGPEAVHGQKLKGLLSMRLD